MNEKRLKAEGIVEKKLSDGLYKIKLSDGSITEAKLSAKQKLNYKELSIGAKVYLEVSDNEKRYDRFLTRTDFKINNWTGWTEEHEPLA